MINSLDSYDDKLGMYEKIEKYITEYPESIKEKYSERNALHVACNNCDYKCVKLLIDAGCDVNETDDYEWTPLMISCINSHNDNYFEIIQLLLNANCDLNTQDVLDGTALIYICKSGKNDKTINLLINAGCDINILDMNGYSAFMHACWSYWYDVDTIKLFIDAGYDICAKDDDNNTVLDVICKYADVHKIIGIVEYLVNVQYDSYVKGLKEGDTFISRSKYVSNMLVVLNTDHILGYDGTIISLYECYDIFIDDEEILND